MLLGVLLPIRYQDLLAEEHNLLVGFVRELVLLELSVERSLDDVLGHPEVLCQVLHVLVQRALDLCLAAVVHEEPVRKHLLYASIFHNWDAKDSVDNLRKLSVVCDRIGQLLHTSNE